MQPTSTGTDYSICTPHKRPSAFDSKAGHIALQMLPNVRDLGYLKTASGQRIAGRKLIRAGALIEASATDIDLLVSTYDVQTVVDLRTPDEREQRPDPVDKMPRARFFNVPILGFSATGVTREDGLAGMAKGLSALEGNPEQLMLDLYPRMLLEEGGIRGYSHFFKILAEVDEGAVLWHCSAGKDRAGLASFLLLSVLGVCHEAIVLDYLATNQYLSERVDDLKKLIPQKDLSEGLLQSLQVLNSASEAFLDAGVAAVVQEYGSVNSYLERALGVDDGLQELLRKKYLL